MRPIAAWLVARPQNAILGLAGTLMLPLAPILSGVVFVLLVLHQGPVRSVLYAAIALALLAAVSMIGKTPLIQIAANALGTWLPVLALAALLRHWRSIALTLQVSVIVGALAILAIFVVFGDPTVFWTEVLREIAPVFAQLGFQEQADVLLTRADQIAPQMTLLVVFTSWSMYVAVLLLGYRLLQTLPDESSRFGRFCDLNLGRVLAIAMATASVAALLSNAAWLQNVAFFMFAVFFLQGLATLHWFFAEGRVPGVVVAVVYVSFLIFNVVLVVGLAVAGYLDAWFDYRKRATGRST